MYVVEYLTPHIQEINGLNKTFVMNLYSNFEPLFISTFIKYISIFFGSIVTYLIFVVLYFKFIRCEFDDEFIGDMMVVIGLFVVCLVVGWLCCNGYVMDVINISSDYCVVQETLRRISV